MSNTKNTAAIVDSICAGIRELPPGPYSEELSHINAALEAKLILDFAPNVGADLIHFFERFPEVQSFSADIDWRLEGGEDGGGDVRVHYLENFSIELTEDAAQDADPDELKEEILEIITASRYADSEDDRFPAFQESMGSVCDAVGGQLSASRATYEALTRQEELTPMAMYTASARDQHRNLVGITEAQFVSTQHSRDDRPRG